MEEQQEVVAVLVGAEVFKAALQYLSEQKFNEVAGLLDALGKSPGVSQEHVERMNVQPELEEAPE